MANFHRSDVSRAPAAGTYTATIESSERSRDPDPGPKRMRSGVRPGLYAAILVATILAATGYKLRQDGLFACEATGYASNRYVAYCQARAYGDYDYGAFWYGLEPATSAAAANADVLFLGNSRMQFALSTDAVARWFGSHAMHYYLLGFAYNGNIGFAGPLLTHLQPRAKVYVINVDQFFREPPTPPAQEVMRDSSALSKYKEKRFWQDAQRKLCTTVASLCRHEFAYYRARENGAWIVRGGKWTARPVVYSDTIDQKRLDTEIALGRKFVAKLPVSRECILLTVTPKGVAENGTSLGTARAIAAALGLTFAAPNPSGLNTFDGSHLDRRSAEVWSAAFIDDVAPNIEKCVSQPRP